MVQIGIKNKHKVKKILIVGLGSIGTRHLQVIKELFPDIKIFALRHKSIKDSEVAEGIELSFVNVKEAIKQKPDMAIIANPSPMHLVIATDLADAGIHLLIEKPLSNNCEGVSELLSLSSAICTAVFPPMALWKSRPVDLLMESLMLARPLDV
mgnify:CR=1 FL=1